MTGERLSAASHRTVRCTYCLEWLPLSRFTKAGDHVIPAALGGGWVDAQVCETCNRRANAVADELVTKDPVSVFLRSSYGIRDRYGKVPKPPRVPVRTAAGSVVLVTLKPGAMEFAPATLAPEDADSVDVGTPGGSTDRLRQVVARTLGEDAAPADLAKTLQPASTPRDAWSRFIAKVALACGREAYGEEWLDGPYARLLSKDLLRDGRSPVTQVDPHPPVKEAWPWEPPVHRIWIEDHDGTAVLMAVLFGQVWAAIAVNRSGLDAYPTAWALDPVKATVDRSSYHGMWFAVSAARATATGRDTILMDLPQGPVLYIEDGPDGPLEIGAPAIPVASPQDAVERIFSEGEDFFKRWRAH